MDRLRAVCALVTAGLLAAFTAARAQGVSTAAIHGTITTGPGRKVDARVRVTHDSTGYTTEVRASNGRYLVQGLEPGGPYTVTIRALGFVPERIGHVSLQLGELREIDVVLHAVAARLDTVAVTADAGAGQRARADGGTSMAIGQAVLDHVPTLNRDVYDFVRLVPQISTKIGLPNPGFSAGGMGFRYNNFLINGVSERTLSGGVSNAFAGNKSIPIDAVQEYQVLLSPYDVRYGDFAGALVNTVTRSGTNAFHGSLFGYGRNDRLARSVDGGDVTRYERGQYGFSLGGPVIPNRLQFFVAPELQRFTFPADGPYVGEPRNSARQVPVSAADLARFDTIMRGYGLTAGSAGPVENGNPLRNIFTRFDLALPEWNSRATIWNNYSGGDALAFSRASLDTFSLSSYQVTRASQARMSAIDVHTTLPRAGGGENELLVSGRSEALDAIGDVQQPIVRVSVPSISGGRITLTSGTHESAQGNGFRSSAVSAKENLTLPLGARHVATLGGELERFRVRSGGPTGSYGSWTFASLDNLAGGTADRYEINLDFGNADAVLTGAQYSAHVGDQWQVTRGLSITDGVRADVLAIDGHAPFEPAVDSIFGRRTDEMPRRRVELAPRLGFVWNVAQGGEQELRGGVGIFTSRYPLAWVQSALSSYGVNGLLRCNVLGSTAKYPPAFVADYRTPPQACGGGSVAAPSFSGDVDLLDPNLRLVRVERASLAYERRLPLGLRLTEEAMVSRGLSDPALVNLNLADSRSTDGHGRVMYGTIGATGVATPNPRSGFSEVIDLRSVAGDQAYQLSTRLETNRGARLNGSASYTYSRARDVETLLRVNTRGTTAWASARVNSGRDDDLSAGTSSNDIPHRLVLAGTFAQPWSRGRTELSFYYIGESGRPFTYIAFGALGRGDLNADGSNANDPIYVPRNALDTAEIRFSGVSDSAGADNSAAAQASREQAERAGLQNFIERNPCLRRQRGRILARNGCREPWSNTTIASVRQVVPRGNRAIEGELQVFNVLNLLNAKWGDVRQAAPALLEQVGQTAGSPQTSQPIFRFDPSRPAWTVDDADSRFQIQLAVRYRF